MTKNQRQHRIGELLEREVISTAAQLVTRLQAEDIVATQATVTRRPARTWHDQGSRRARVAPYCRRHGPKCAAPLDHLRRMMGEWVVSVDYSANLVVLRTPPGCAHVVASALDRSVLDGVLGSVAGDDTVLVISSEGRGGASSRRSSHVGRIQRTAGRGQEGKVVMAKRVVLAYSGGLDTSVAVRWMIEEWGVEVVCVLVNVDRMRDSSESFDDIKARPWRRAHLTASLLTRATKWPKSSARWPFSPTPVMRASTRWSRPLASRHRASPR